MSTTNSNSDQQQPARMLGFVETSGPHSSRDSTCGICQEIIGPKEPCVTHDRNPPYSPENEAPSGAIGCLNSCHIACISEWMIASPSISCPSCRTQLEDLEPTLDNMRSLMTDEELALLEQDPSGDLQSEHIEEGIAQFRATYSTEERTTQSTSPGQDQ